MGGKGLVADLRSDTLTRPTRGMREAMLTAEVGDDVYGEDPTVVELEEETARLLGHEAGLFMPTGSMANQIGLRLHAGPGQEIIGDHLAHVLRAELGAAAAYSGITTRSWIAERGRLDVDTALRVMVPDGGAHQVSTACVVVENTHNFGGGTIQPLPDLQRLRRETQAVGIGVHLDGARLWNAHVATGVALADYGACADTVSVCLSKGLGAPVGSVLVSSAERIAQARILRKRMGGGMRQVGLLAAAGRYALAHQLERLAEDHARAASVGRHVPEAVDPGTVETNILVLDVAAAGWPAAEFVATVGERGVLGYPTDTRHARFVWHLDVDDAMTEHTADVLVDALRERRPGPAS
ncbi:Low-specificity L-threonine aldolase [Serinicoccus hydrothermalis]|uniref:Low-specificity L-threonine aldolase n=1 Tax=Serinicoccus hydrothermalis TaxID=1758689 RepID=A0A1B1NA01_9MICO|nr:GntG family PLP-dependent aldolase [Serinicoccus hydrothermalis]ANS78205.1 Low-specificity L-threonine aldolase [Serinicoccus hydrothermalis]